MITSDGNSVDVAEQDYQKRTWLENVSAKWSENAADWDKIAESETHSCEWDDELSLIKEHLLLDRNFNVFDAGCCSGQYAIAFAQMGCNVIAMDIAEGMIECAREHSSDLNVEIDWRIGDISLVDAPSQSFDAIHAQVVLQFVPDLKAVLVEFRRILRPGGRLLVSVPGAMSPIYAKTWLRFIDTTSGTLSENSHILPWELISVLNHLGWTVVHEWGVYGCNMDGDQSGFKAEDMNVLDIRLQRAAATAWIIVAE